MCSEQAENVAQKVLKLLISRREYFQNNPKYSSLIVCLNILSKIQDRFYEEQSIFSGEFTFFQINSRISRSATVYWPSVWVRIRNNLRLRFQFELVFILGRFAFNSIVRRRLMLRRPDQIDNPLVRVVSSLQAQL